MKASDQRPFISQILHGTVYYLTTGIFVYKFPIKSLKWSQSVDFFFILVEILGNIFFWWKWKRLGAISSWNWDHILQFWERCDTKGQHFLSLHGRFQITVHISLEYRSKMNSPYTQNLTFEFWAFIEKKSCKSYFHLWLGVTAFLRAMLLLALSVFTTVFVQVCTPIWWLYIKLQYHLMVLCSTSTT